MSAPDTPCDWRGLANRSRSRHLGRTMKRWSGDRIRRLHLALVLALGMSLSFVHGGVMAAEMAVSAGSGGQGPSGCVECDGGGDGGASVSTCLAVCGAAAQGLVPGQPVALPPASGVSLQAVHLLLDGRCSSPDHGPPKILTLG